MVAGGTLPSCADGGALKVAVGATFETMTFTCTGALTAPRASVTTSVAVYVPLSGYAWVGFAPLAPVPSPNFHAYATIASPSGSVPEPTKAIGAFSAPLYDVPAFATGGWCTVIGALAKPVSPSLSLNENRTVYVPDALYVCEA